MSNLEKLKQQMMIKPDVQERKPVAIFIKTKPAKISTSVPKSKTTEEEGEEGEEGEVEERGEVAPPQKLVIVNEIQKGFDRQGLLDKIKQQQLGKVVTKPILEITESKRVIEPIIEAVVEPVRPKKTSVAKIKKGKLRIKEDIVGEIIGELPVIQINEPIKRTRISVKPEKGVAVLGPEINVVIGDTLLPKRLHKREPLINIKASSYYMNNREIFVNFINSLFEPYRIELEQNKNSISCDDIGKTTSSFSLLTHQKIVRDYMNLYTPYRGILLYHGLGSGKTATSIGIAEGMKSAKRVIILTPASLRANYVEELKKAGDLLYKKNQFWEWMSTDGNPELMNTISAVLNLPREYIHKQHGAWFINATKQSNYDSLTDIDRKTLDAQLDVMINEKYTFINYNGLRSKRLGELTNGFTNNLFDNSVVIIDEAHNLISRIVNKLKKEKPIPEDDRGEKEHLPINLSIKLYEYLLSAKNARIVLLSGTPVINYPNEFGILFNILRGYIKTWHITLNIKTNKKVDRNVLNNILIGEKSHDYLDYSPASKVLTITRNPFGFKNKIKKTGEYKGVSNDNPGFETDFISDDDFEKTILSILHRNDIDVVSSGIRIRNQKALPDDFDQFYNRYIDSTTHALKNVDALKRRIIGLSSYFRSAQENLLPRYNKRLGVDYHVVRIPMSNFQFKTYESARIQERKTEKAKKAPPPGSELAEPSSTYRIFSRLFCNYVMPNRPLPKDIGIEQSAKSGEEAAIKDSIRKELITQTETQRVKLLSKDANEIDANEIDANEIDMGKKIDEEIEKTVDIIFAEVIKRKTTGEKKPTKRKSKKDKDKDLGPLESNGLLDIKIDDIETIIERQLSQSDVEEVDTKNNVSTLLKDAQRIEAKQDVTNEEEGELEGDEILDEIGGDTYKERIVDALRFLQDNSNEYLAPEALQTYSPKFLHMLENIKDPEYKGLHLVYSQFRTLEGIGIFSLVLDKNGFTRFKIKKSTAGVWEMDIAESDLGKPTYALYTGTETTEEKEIIRHIYNGEWDQIPDTISKYLEKIANNNNLGEIIKVLMITSSGSEGINLRNTRYVHIMEPYWHPVRLEQVIGRARRICSHKNLPEELQTVEVFVYLMIFTDEQLKSDEAIELKRKDLSRGIPKVPLTSDQNLYEISEIKSNLTSQLTEAIKESAFDCYIYNNGKCVNFADPTVDKFSYVPDYAAQQNDTTTIANKVAIEWVGKPINIAGVDYVYRRMSKDVLNIYDKSSYEGAMNNSSIIPLQIGTVEVNERGEKVFRQLVSG